MWVLVLVIGIVASVIFTFGTGGVRTAFLDATAKIDRSVRDAFGDDTTVGGAYRATVEPDAADTNAATNTAAAEPAPAPAADAAAGEVPESTLGTPMPMQTASIPVSELPRLLREAREEQAGAELWLQILLNAVFTVFGAALSPVMGLIVRH